MPLPLSPYKGSRDFYPKDKRLQDYLFAAMRKVAKSYGYEEYDAPILEPIELYKAKTGDEIVNDQTYSFTDRGGREVAIRPEMTPTVSRMVAARRQELPYPLRWFSIPNLWRYERPQRGRLREHWQLNVDIFGEEGLAADHEIISVADSLLKEFGAKASMYKIKLNSRRLIDRLMLEYLNLSNEQASKLIKLLDKMHKISPDDLHSQLDKIDDGKNQLIHKVSDLMKIKSIDELPEPFNSASEAATLSDLINLLDETGTSNAEFDISLMRGFDYYTDIVFEVFDTHPENNRSLFGGGRYDGLVGLFGVDPVPTVGFGMGDVTLANFLESHNLLPIIGSDTDLILVLVGDVYSQAAKLADKFREMGVNVSIDATKRKLDKKIKTADKQGVKYILFVGEEEIKNQQYKLKNLETGDEEKHGPERIVSIIKDQRS